MPTNNPPAPARASALSRLGDPIVLLLTVGFIVAFVGLSLFDVDLVADSISAGFAWTAATLGTFFQLLLLLTFLIAIGVAISPATGARVGNLESPQIGTFKWLSMIMCTLLAGGACSSPRASRSITSW